MELENILDSLFSKILLGSLSDKPGQFNGKKSSSNVSVLFLNDEKNKQRQVITGRRIGTRASDASRYN